MQHERDVNAFIERLQHALGDALQAVVLYGPEAHGDEYRAVGDINLMIVMRDLEPGTLRGLREPVRRWLKTGQPWPRLFSPAMIASSTDVFPMEFLDIAEHHQVLYGEDPLADLDIDAAHLRLQCERELREKLMRLQEGYIEATKDKALQQLLAASFTSFTAIFRGCLRLWGQDVPRHDTQVVEQFGSRLDLDTAPLLEVEALGEGKGSTSNLEDLFSRYYAVLRQALSRIDRLEGDAT